MPRVYNKNNNAFHLRAKASELSGYKNSKINCPEYFLAILEEMKHLPVNEQTLIERRKRFGGAGVHVFKKNQFYFDKPRIQNRWLNDNILCSSQSNILKYSNIFEKSIEYYKEGLCFNQETYIAIHALKNGIDFCGAPFTTYELWRSDNSKYDNEILY